MAIKYSREQKIFHGREAPEDGYIVGYAALNDTLKLEMPMPKKLSLINKKYKQYGSEDWLVFTPRHQPAETVYDQLVFALKYEGINLLFFKKLFEKISKQHVSKFIQTEYTGKYARKIWFLYEWLMNDQLPIPDLNIKNFIPLVDEKLQYASQVSLNSIRHRIKNNFVDKENLRCISNFRWSLFDLYCCLIGHLMPNFPTLIFIFELQLNSKKHYEDYDYIFLSTYDVFFLY